MKKPRDRAWPRPVTGRNGIAYVIRPISPDDVQRERDFIAGLSAQSRYRRFMFALNEPTPQFVEQLVNVDTRRDMALVAGIADGPDERIIGVARYAADEGGIDCEFAVVVADEYQGCGIGTTLALALFDHAREQGFRMIYGTIQPDNERMIALARRLDLELEPPRPKMETLRAWRLLK